MRKTMKNIASLALVLMLICSMTVTVSAAGSPAKVTYKGNAEKFVFQPGSDWPPTDLFTDFKGVMPGDTLTQTINVRNDASKKVKVKLYIRALGPAELRSENGEEIVSRTDSAELLREMTLRVDLQQKTKLFEAPADQKDGLEDWVCLGTFYSGADVDLDVKLDVPLSMSNDFQERIGALDWQFMAEEYPVDSGETGGTGTGSMTRTGDDSRMFVYVIIAAAALAGAAAVVISRRRKS